MKVVISVFCFLISTRDKGLRSGLYEARVGLVSVCGMMRKGDVMNDKERNGTGEIESTVVMKTEYVLQIITTKSNNNNNNDINKNGNNSNK